VFQASIGARGGAAGAPQGSESGLTRA